ncbi:MAG TPA: CheR family methyltransferase [Thermomicrobiales bacterium]|nr:CheR family methyltransferase [Thermomicrobiales bacterium]
MPPASEAKTDHLIVVGASAGGVEALSQFVGALPADLAAPVVIAQHLDPARPSHLAEILSRQTPLPVRSVEPREALASGTVFVVPSNRHVTITDHHVDVHPDPTRRPTPSVDLLLATAAATFGERLIAVILTGSGSDGAAGAHAVKEAGGTVVIQDPETAAFPSMPRSLAPSLVDFSLPVNEMGAALADLLAAPPPEQATGDPDLARVLDRLRERHGIDFGAYKPATITRRLWRRVAAVGMSTLADYRTYLEAHPEEEQRLITDFLIKVTRFFRDPALFERLREDIVPELVAAARQDGRELRMWSAGCATGEEAYSLALLVAEALAAAPKPSPPVRIFATDLDEAALAFARRGIYPATALADVPEELVARYFTQHDGAVEVTKAVRGLIVFGSHDLAQRPPFPRTDLVLCRNVLIYFAPELQRRALEIFAYSLREGGVLVLGKSETIGAVKSGFDTIDRRARIYRRQGPRPALPPARLPTTAEAAPARGTTVLRSRSALERALRQAEADTEEARFTSVRAEEVVRQLPVGMAIVNRDYDLEVINGAARELLGVHGLALGQDLIHLAQRLPSTALRTAIDAVLAGEPPQALDPVVTTDTATGETRHLSVSCHRNRATTDGVVEAVLILVTDVTATTEAATRAEAELATLRETTGRQAAANRQLLAANRELTDTVDRLREQGDELRQAAAAAQVAAEEIETLNEELQSSNEELETLHEEAQATVEELNVANDELHARSTELEELAAEHAAERARLSAVLASMGDAVVVVDAQGRVMRTNAAYDALVGTLGAPFVSADAQGIPLPSTQTPESRVARGEAFRLEFTAAAADGSRRWFEATGRPLSGEVDDVAGVLVIRDITDRTMRQLQEEFLTWASHELRTPLTALQGYLQLAERRVDPSVHEQVHRFLTLAIQETRRQASLVTELMDATRLQSGKLELEPAPMDLVPMVLQTVESAGILTQGQTIAFAAPSEPVVVSGDASRLEQVLLNLLTNAITHAPGTERIDVRVQSDDGMAEVIVQDAGPGIPTEELETIFGRFAQVNPKERTGRAGLGLGLFIAREIVEAHAGTITAQSAPGHGATFTVRLPLLPRADD